MHLSLHIAGVHCLLLLGIIGPSNGRFWWVPDPNHQPHSVLLLFLIGVVHYFGVGVTMYQSMDSFECPVPSDVYWFATHPTSPMLPSPTTTVAEWQGRALLINSCTLDSGGLLSGPGGCGTPCVSEGNWAAHIVAFSLSVPDPTAVTVSDAVAQAVAAAGCVLKDGYPWGQWTVTDCIYFCMVLLTTVGYGNTFAPGSSASRDFTTVYALIGIFIFGAGSGVVVRSVGRIVHSAYTAVARAFASGPSPVAVVIRPQSTHANAPAMAAPFEPPISYHFGRGLYMNFVAFCVLNYCSAAVFWAVEDQWTYVDALYHCFMTATTIGLGDIAPQTQAGRGFAVVHMPLCVGLFASVISTIVDALQRRDNEAKKEEMLRRQVDEDLITSLDKDGNGIDRTEYVLGMLVALGTVSEADYRPFLENFDQLDTMGDGLLRKEDLSKIVIANREAAATKARAEQQRTFANRVHQHAKQLMLPTGLACSAFLWNSLFGYLLFGAGLINGLAIGMLLGSPPTRLAAYRRAVALVTVSSLLTLTSFIMIIVFLSAPRTYLDIDALMSDRVLTTLDDGGLTVRLSTNLQDQVLNSLEDLPAVVFVLWALYLCTFIVMLFVSMQVVRTSIGAYHEAKLGMQNKAPAADEKDASGGGTARGERL